MKKKCTWYILVAAIVFSPIIGAVALVCFLVWAYSIPVVVPGLCIVRRMGYELPKPLEQLYGWALI